MRAILEYFRVKKIIRYHGQMENLESILEAMENKPLEKEDFYLKKTDRFKYDLNPPVSVGTPQVYVSGMLVYADEIKVKMNLHSNSDNLQEIQLLGSLHRFHLLMFFAGLFGFIGSIYALVAHGQYVGLIAVAVLWPIFHLWFNFVWTSQEKALIDEIKIALHIRIRAGIGL